ncbi:MAG: S8/S53 family peptidase [Acidimicrobiales bacterium]
MVLLTADDEDDGVPQILDEIRLSNRATRAPQVAPNHVFFGTFHNMWGPARPVELATEPLPTFPDFDNPDEDGDASLAAALLDGGDADVINLSLGGYTYDSRGAYAFGRAVNHLRRQNPDVALVAAAGNDHTDRPFFPAATKGVIAVAAHDPKNKDKRAD